MNHAPNFSSASLINRHYQSYKTLTTLPFCHRKNRAAASCCRSPQLVLWRCHSRWTGIPLLSSTTDRKWKKKEIAYETVGFLIFFSKGLLLMTDDSSCPFVKDSCVLFGRSRRFVIVQFTFHGALRCGLWSSNSSSSYTTIRRDERVEWKRWASNRKRKTNIVHFAKEWNRRYGNQAVAEYH